MTQALADSFKVALDSRLHDCRGWSPRYSNVRYNGDTVFVRLADSLRDVNIETVFENGPDIELIKLLSPYDICNNLKTVYATKGAKDIFEEFLTEAGPKIKGTLGCKFGVLENDIGMIGLAKPADTLLLRACVNKYDSALSKPFNLKLIWSYRYNKMKPGDSLALHCFYNFKRMNKMGIKVKGKIEWDFGKGITYLQDYHENGSLFEETRSADDRAPQYWLLTINGLGYIPYRFSRPVMVSSFEISKSDFDENDLEKLFCLMNAKPFPFSIKLIAANKK